MVDTREMINFIMSKKIKIKWNYLGRNKNITVDFLQRNPDLVKKFNNANLSMYLNVDDILSKNVPFSIDINGLAKNQTLNDKIIETGILKNVKINWDNIPEFMYKNLINSIPDTTKNYYTIMAKYITKNFYEKKDNKYHLWNISSLNENNNFNKDYLLSHGIYIPSIYCFKNPNAINDDFADLLQYEHTFENYEILCSNALNGYCTQINFDELSTDYLTLSDYYSLTNLQNNNIPSFFKKEISTNKTLTPTIIENQIQEFDEKFDLFYLLQNPNKNIRDYCWNTFSTNELKKNISNEFTSYILTHYGNKPHSIPFSQFNKINKIINWNDGAVWSYIDFH